MLHKAAATSVLSILLQLLRDQNSLSTALAEQQTSSLVQQWWQKRNSLLGASLPCHTGRHQPSPAPKTHSSRTMLCSAVSLELLLCWGAVTGSIASQQAALQGEVEEPVATAGGAVPGRLRRTANRNTQGKMLHVLCERMMRSSLKTPAASAVILCWTSLRPAHSRAPATIAKGNSATGSSSCASLLSPVWIRLTTNTRHTCCCGTERLLSRRLCRTGPAAVASLSTASQRTRSATLLSAAACWT